MESMDYSSKNKEAEERLKRDTPGAWDLSKKYTPSLIAQGIEDSSSSICL